MKKFTWLETILSLGFIGFLYISFVWIKQNGVSGANNMMAFATIIYAVMTFLMYWSSKSSSEARIRPLLFTSLNGIFDLNIENKMKDNSAKNIKIKVKAIKIGEKNEENPIMYFMRKSLSPQQISPIFDYKNLFKKKYEIWDSNKSLSLSKHIAESFFKDNEKWYNIILKGLTPNDSEFEFKLLVHIVYESLLDIKYELNETYLVKITPNGTEIKKEWDEH